MSRDGDAYGNLVHDAVCAGLASMAKAARTGRAFVLRAPHRFVLLTGFLGSARACGLDVGAGKGRQAQTRAQGTKELADSELVPVNYGTVPGVILQRKVVLAVLLP